MGYVFRILNVDGTDVKLNPESEQYQIMVVADSLDEAITKVSQSILADPNLTEDFYTTRYIGEGNQIQQDLAKMTQDW